MASALSCTNQERSPVEKVNASILRDARVLVEIAGRGAAELSCRDREELEWRRLVEEQGAVEGVALDGFEAGFADDAAEFFFVAPPGLAKRSSRRTAPTSLPPKRRPICRTLRPWVAQEPCRFRMLSR